MKHRTLAPILAVCVALASTPYPAQAREPGSGGCDTQCQKVNELKLMGIVYGGMVVIALTVGGIYLLLKDGDTPELAETLGNDEGLPFRLVPHTERSDRHGVDLEFRLSKASRIGLRAQYERSRDQAASPEEAIYFGGVFYRVSF